MIGWLKKLITGRGIGPSRNRAWSRERQIEQTVESCMDAWRVAEKRGEALAQLDRFRSMAEGGDGGVLREGHEVSVRKMHYRKWKDGDFVDLVGRLEEEIESARAREAAAAALEGGSDDVDE